MIVENHVSIEPYRGQGERCIGRNVYRLLGSEMSFVQYTESSKHYESIIDVLAKKAGNGANHVSQKHHAVDEFESLVLENASKAVLDTKDSIETIPPCEKFNKQLQFIQLFFKRLLGSQGYSQPDIHTTVIDSNEFLELESSMLGKGEE